MDNFNDLEKKKNYYKINAEKYKQKMRCETCGGSFNLTNRSHHCKTKRHLWWNEKNNKIHLA